MQSEDGRRVGRTRTTPRIKVQSTSFPKNREGGTDSDGGLLKNVPLFGTTILPETKLSAVRAT